MRTLSFQITSFSLLAWASAATAGLVITAPDVVVAPNSSGNFFDIELDYETPDLGALEIAGFSVDIHLQPFNSGLSIVDVSDATASPYLFGAFDAGIDTIGHGFSLTNNSQSAEFGDILILPPAATSVAINDTFGLGRVFFDVGDTDPGVYDITVTGAIPAGLSRLDDTVGNAVPFTVRTGTITVQAQAVPEPGFAAPFLALLALGVTKRRRKSARTPKSC